MDSKKAKAKDRDRLLYLLKQIPPEPWKKAEEIIQRGAEGIQKTAFKKQNNKQTGL